LPPILQQFSARFVSPRISGTYRGVRAAVYTQTRSSNSRSYDGTVIKTYYTQPLPFDLHLAREGVAARIVKAFGGQDVEVGDAEFDSAVRVKTDNPDAARALLAVPALKKAAGDAVASCPGLRATR